MKPEEVKKVIEIIKKNPKDSFWVHIDEEKSDCSNAYLFEDIVEMVNKAGYDLKLTDVKVAEEAKTYSLMYKKRLLIELKDVLEKIEKELL